MASILLRSLFFILLISSVVQAQDYYSSATTSIPPTVTYIRSATSYANGSSSIYLNIDCGTDNNRLAVIDFLGNNDGEISAGVTVGSSSATPIDSSIGSPRVWRYALVNPPTGTRTVTVNFDKAVRSQLIVSIYKNVNQSTPLLGTLTKRVEPGTSISNTISGGSSSEIVYEYTVCNDVSTLQAANSQVERASETNGDYGYVCKAFDKIGAADVTMTTTSTTDQNLVQILSRIKGN